MGYLLPIRPISSEQYAIRMEMKQPKFTHINEVSSIRDEQLHGMETRAKSAERKENNKPVVEAPITYNGWIYPNPANLSPTLAKVVGKGLRISTYR